MAVREATADMASLAVARLVTHHQHILVAELLVTAAFQHMANRLPLPQVLVPLLDLQDEGEVVVALSGTIHVTLQAPTLRSMLDIRRNTSDVRAGSWAEMNNTCSLSSTCTCVATNLFYRSDFHVGPLYNYHLGNADLGRCA
jgi:hypothetical protein